MALTSWARSRVVTRRASGVSTTTTSSRPTTAITRPPLGTTSPELSSSTTDLRVAQHPDPGSAASSAQHVRQRVEVADVVPSEARGHRCDAAGSGSGLGDGVVDRDPGEGRPDLRHPAGIRREVPQRRCQLRMAVGQEVEQHRRTDDEHAGVPAVLPGVDVAASQLQVRLLDELSHHEGAGMVGEGGAVPDVAERRRRAARGDADRDQPVVARHRHGGVHGLGEGVGVGDDMVGGEGGHHRAGVGELELRGGQADRGHRLTRRGLREDLLGGQLGKLSENGVSMGGPGDYQHPLVAQRHETVDGLLEQGAPAAGEVVQELRRSGSRQRPEPRPRASGGNRRPRSQRGQPCPSP